MSLQASLGGLLSIYVVAVAISVVVAVVLKRIFLQRLARIARTTPWRWDDVIVQALPGLVVPTFGILGLYVARQLWPVDTRISDVLDSMMLVVLIVLVSTLVARMVSGVVGHYGDEIQKDLPSTTIFQNFMKVLIFVIGGLVILQTLGISITPVLTALGVGGLAVALALQDTLSNFFSGIHILLAKKIKVGDYLQMDSGQEGYVTDVTWRSTTIRALPNNIIIVPNAKLAQAVITNFNLPQQEMSVLIQVGVSYDSDLEHVERVTVEVAKEVMRDVVGGLPNFEPMVRYHTFGDFSINFSVILRTNEFVNQYLIKHEFIKRIHRRYDQEGIEIPFPIQTIYMADDSGLTD
jgi:small-conductance mechanosensitive channel